MPSHRPLKEGLGPHGGTAGDRPGTLRAGRWERSHRVPAGARGPAAREVAPAGGRGGMSVRPSVRPWRAAGGPLKVSPGAGPGETPAGAARSRGFPGGGGLLARGSARRSLSVCLSVWAAVRGRNRGVSGCWGYF